MQSSGCSSFAGTQARTVPQATVQMLEFTGLNTKPLKHPNADYLYSNSSKKLILISQSTSKVNVLLFPLHKLRKNNSNILEAQVTASARPPHFICLGSKCQKGTLSLFGQMQMFSSLEKQWRGLSGGGTGQALISSE